MHLTSCAFGCLSHVHAHPHSKQIDEYTHYRTQIHTQSHTDTHSTARGMHQSARDDNVEAQKETVQTNYSYTEIENKQKTQFVIM